MSEIKGNNANKSGNIEIGSRIQNSNDHGRDAYHKREIPTARDRVTRTTKTEDGKPGGNDR